MAAVVEAFAAAARRAAQAGFDLVELHSAHGYLLHEFLSPLSNARGDLYGGSLPNRMRFPLEVAAAVRESLPATMPLLVRVSATDWVDGGWDLDSTIEYACELKAVGVDLVEASSGGLAHNAKPRVGPMYQAPFARAIREGAGIATAAVGMITELSEARSIVEGGMADLVSIGRLLARSLLAAQECAGREAADPQSIPAGFPFIGRWKGRCCIDFGTGLCPARSLF